MIFMLVDETCCNCFIHFGMDPEFRARRLEDGKTFYCPNGHPQRYSDNEISKLKKENQSLRNQRDYSIREETKARNAASIAKRQKAVAKDQLTRLRNRVRRGICPCCSVDFPDLQEHIKSQHPDFKSLK